MSRSSFAMSYLLLAYLVVTLRCEIRCLITSNMLNIFMMEASLYKCKKDKHTCLPILLMTHSLNHGLMWFGPYQASEQGR